MKREYYSDSISNFISSHPDQIVGTLTLHSEFAVDLPQRDAWLQQIKILQGILSSHEGSILFEFSVPRMGKRIDVVLIIDSVIFVLEFKIGSTQYTSQALTQVWDYALDLKNFHETSRGPLIAPILVATQAATNTPNIAITPQNDNLLFPIPTNAEGLSGIIKHVLSFSNGDQINHSEWRGGRYRPTPTIVEAAIALYNSHSVDEIARNDASAINLGVTSSAVEEIIRISKLNSQKSICFVTGVPGAGKTLVGLNVATQHNDPQNALHSVFLSGNGPLVKVLTEALARDRVQREKSKGLKPKMSRARSEVKAFIQNVHHFRDECLIDETPPHEHVALFDEAQRAWNLQETANFMKQKKKRPNFDQSEPQFLISCLDRHPDWAVIVCLVGGGQEINRGEAGISEWIRSLMLIPA